MRCENEKKTEPGEGKAELHKTVEEQRQENFKSNQHLNAPCARKVHIQQRV